MIVRIIGVLLLVALCGCHYSQSSPASIQPWYPPADENGNPIFGIFEGRIPCVAPELEGCDKIKVALVLYRASGSKIPITYRLARIYVAANPEGNRVVVNGTVTVTHGTALDTEATVFLLDENAPSEFNAYWVIGDDILYILGNNLKPKVGTAGWSYVLNRTR